MDKKREKFVSLAEKRVVRALRDIRIISNLSNRHNYQYSTADVKAIVSALEREIQRLKNKFSQKTPNDEIQFKL